MEPRVQLGTDRTSHFNVKKKGLWCKSNLLTMKCLYHVIKLPCGTLNRAVVLFIVGHFVSFSGPKIRVLNKSCDEEERYEL